MNEQVFQWLEEINAVSEVFNVYPWEYCLVIEILRRLTESFTVFDFPPFLCAGYNCQVNIDECASNPCLNQGTCFDDVSGYTCHCVLPYTGEFWGPGAGRDARSCLVVPNLGVSEMGSVGAVMLPWGITPWSPFLPSLSRSSTLRKHCGLSTWTWWGCLFAFIF